MMDDRTLVKMSAGEYCIGFRTVSRSRKSPREFLVTRDALEKLETDCAFITQDIHSYASFCRDVPAGTIRVEFAWLQGTTEGKLSGYREYVTLPYEGLMEFCHSSAEEGGPTKWAVLSVKGSRQPRLVFYDVKGLRRCVSNGRVRRKLARFLRDNFKYPSVDEIGFYSDFVPYSFLFREVRGGAPGVVGGLILHGQEDMEKAYYGIHT